MVELLQPMIQKLLKRSLLYVAMALIINTIISIKELILVWMKFNADS